MAWSPNPARISAPSAAGRRTIAAGNALGVASMLAWAAGFPAAELLLGTWSPLALITARFLLAVALLIPLWAVLEGPRVLLHARWGRGTWIGGLSFGFGAWLLLVAQSLTDPITVALIASATPLAATLLEVLYRTRTLTRRFIAGLGASVLGGAIATSALAPAGLGAGAACALVSVFLFSWGSHATIRDLPGLSPIGRSTITLAGGLMAMSALFGGALVLGLDVVPRGPIGTDQVGLLLIYALASMAFSQVMWIASVGRLGVAMASFHINLVPFYVMAVMWSLGTGWNWTQALGAAVVGIGVVIAQRPQSGGG